MRRSDLRAWGAFPSEAMCQQRECDVARFGICRPRIVESRPGPRRRGAEIWCVPSPLSPEIVEDLQTRATRPATIGRNFSTRLSFAPIEEIAMRALIVSVVFCIVGVVSTVPSTGFWRCSTGATGRARSLRLLPRGTRQRNSISGRRCT